MLKVHDIYISTYVSYKVGNVDIRAPLSGQYRDTLDLACRLTLVQESGVWRSGTGFITLFAKAMPIVVPTMLHDVDEIRKDICIPVSRPRQIHLAGVTYCRSRRGSLQLNVACPTSISTTEHIVLCL